MKFIKEDEFVKLMQSAGIVHCDHGRSLCYRDEGAVLGFDFTNMNMPDRAATPFEGVAAGDRSVEYAMISTVLKVITELDLFPLYLYPADDDWADEDLKSLVKNRVITQEEGAALSDVIDNGHGMDVVVIEKDQADIAVRLIAPQVTAFSTTICAADAKGRVLTVFSQDDEVSFNTTDKEVYEKADRMVRSLSGLPFEVIRAEDI